MDNAYTLGKAIFRLVAVTFALAHYPALLLFPAATGYAAETLIPLKVGYLSIAAGHSVLWVAKEARIVEKNGLSVETVYAPSSALTQAMLSRSIPLGITGPVSPLEANVKGADFVILGTLRKTPTPGLFGKPQEDYERQAATWKKAWSGPVRERNR